MAMSMAPRMLLSSDIASWPGDDHGVRSETVQMVPARNPNRFANVKSVPDSISTLSTRARFQSAQ